jgi:hypothetical protein
MTILWEFDEKHHEQVSAYGAQPHERIPRITRSERTAPQSLLLDDGVVSVGDQLLLDRGSLRAIRKWPYLDV